MNVRTDNWHVSGWKRAHRLAGKEVAESILVDPSPEAQPGDVWVIRFYPNEENHLVTTVRETDGPIVGYAITCPNEQCEFGAHDWTWAANCSQPTEGGCVHMEERRSCWEWTGSPQENTLSASPSLFSPVEKGGCGWHGHLVNGEMVG